MEEREDEFCLKCLEKPIRKGGLSQPLRAL